VNDTLDSSNVLLLGRLVKHIGHSTLSAVLSIKVRGHEDTGTALRVVTLSPQSSNLSILIDLVVTKHGQLDLLLLVLVLLRSRVILLLSLLGTTTKPKHKVKGRLLLNVIIGQCSTILKLLAGKDQTLLVRRDALLVLDLGLDIFNRVGSLDLKSNGLARKGLNEDLHLEF